MRMMNDRDSEVEILQRNIENLMSEIEEIKNKQNSLHQKIQLIADYVQEAAVPIAEQSDEDSNS